MTLNLFFHALWTLSALGVVVCAAETVRPRDVAAFAAAFSVSMWWFDAAHPPDPAWIGFVAAAVAAHRLVWPQRITVVAAAGGLFAGVCATLMTFEGLPSAAAAALTAGLAATSAYLSTRPGFAPAALREEAMMALLVLGLGVAIAPGVVTGWTAAQALNIPAQNTSAPVVPSWVIAVSGGAIVLGGAYRLWRR